MKKEILYANKWINVIKLDDWYVCTDEVRTKNNDFVCVLPYTITNSGIKKYLLRMEHNPAHQEKGNVLSVITGQCETGVVLYHAEQELKEEGGYTIESSRFISLGTCMPLKSSMAKMNMFAVQIFSNDIPHEAKGDGTIGENNSYPIWTDRTNVLECKDPYAQSALLRLEAI